MLGSNFVKFLMPILKRKVDSSPIFVSLFSFMRLFLCTLLVQTIYTFLKRSSLKWNFLRLLSARVKFCQIPFANFEPTSWFFSKFCIPLQFYERFILYTFLDQTIYTLLKRSSLKWQCLRLLSARVKIHQIPHVNFEMASQFLFKFCIILHCHDT